MAKRVKQKFVDAGRPEISVSYAASWGEYHHSQRAKAKLYPLDKLWSNDNIDFIGIDAYSPLTDTADNITYEDIYAGWTKGHQWDYYKDQGIKVPYSNQTFALKAIRHWWENEHIDLDGNSTNWKPKSKPIWFTELGSASCDHSSNAPHIFVHEGEIQIPNSKSKLDLEHQRNLISASLDYIKENLSDVVEQVFIYNWDVRHIDEDPRYIRMLDQAKKEVQNYGLETDEGNGNFTIGDVTFSAPSFDNLPDWPLGHWICGKL